MALFLTILIWTLIALLFLAGLLGSLIPVLPGTPLVLSGIILYAWWTDFTVITWPWIAYFTILTGVSLLLDYLFSVLAPRKIKASWWAVAGAFIGLMVGVFFGLPGILLGPILMAALLEYFHTRKTGHSIEAGIATFFGFVIGTAVKVGITLTMIAAFFFRVWIS